MSRLLCKRLSAPVKASAPLSHMHLNAVFREVLMLQDWLCVLFCFFFSSFSFLRMGLWWCTIGETGAGTVTSVFAPIPCYKRAVCTWRLKTSWRKCAGFKANDFSVPASNISLRGLARSLLCCRCHGFQSCLASHQTRKRESARECATPIPRSDCGRAAATCRTLGLSP